MSRTVENEGHYCSDTFGQRSQRRADRDHAVDERSVRRDERSSFINDHDVIAIQSRSIARISDN